jgi:molybdopterin molybdotransferase
MISVEEATRIILSNRYKPETVSVALEQAGNAFLAEAISADRDFPPFDRVSMDGIAISSAAFAAGQREFVVDGVQAAGVPQKRLGSGTHCLEVMTGAVVPEGVDLVIRYEDIEIANGKAIVMSDEHFRGQNIHSQGADVRRGDVLLLPGTLLSPAEIALLASVGKSKVLVRRYPKTAVVSTGDELVDITATPEEHQIRRSNSYALAAALREAGVSPGMFHIPDQEGRLRDDLRGIASDHELIILTGGVSRGKFDYVPAILQELGVEMHFHGVAQRPGKPFWFGTAKDDKTFFALPGNPVSTYMCFYRYVLPWLRQSMGSTTSPLTAFLAEDFTFMPIVTCFLQVRCRVADGKLMASPAPGGGSGDFANLGQVDGFLELPAESTVFRAGDVYPYVPFRLLE